MSAWKRYGCAVKWFLNSWFFGPWAATRKESCLTLNIIVLHHCQCIVNKSSDINDDLGPGTTWISYASLRISIFNSKLKENRNYNGKNVLQATKGKCKQKFKKSLYGKREYASKKPLLSPIAEVLDIWSESTDFSNSEGMLECETPKRTSLIHLEGK